MTIKELLWQEIETTPAEWLEDLLNFLKAFKTDPKHHFATYQKLLDRIDYLEAIVGIRKGLEELDRGKGIPAEEALATLKHKLQMSPRP